MNKSYILLGGIFLLSIYIIYSCHISENYVQIETVVSIPSSTKVSNIGTLNDCLSTCSADLKCYAAEYDEKIGCKVSMRKEELTSGFGNVYVKKDRFKSDVYMDPNQREFILETPTNVQTIDWELDIPYIPISKKNFDQKYKQYEKNRETQSNELGIKPLEKFTNVNLMDSIYGINQIIDYNIINYKMHDYDISRYNIW